MRAILGALAGAIVLFAWGAVFWMGLAWAFDGLRSLEPEQEQALVAALNENIPKTGAYYFPGMPTHGKDLPDDEAKRLTEDWQARHEAGPIGQIIFVREGKKAMDPVLFVRGFAIDIVSTVLVSILVIMTGTGGAGFCKRFAVVAIFGLAASTSVHLIDWNWMFTPTPFTIMKVVDTTVGWVLAGIVMAAIIKTPKPK
jgi:hypothetical protein